jgi:hypothetical protein
VHPTIVSLLALLLHCTQAIVTHYGNSLAREGHRALLALHSDKSTRVSVINCVSFGRVTMATKWASQYALSALSPVWVIIDYCLTTLILQIMTHISIQDLISSSS